MAIARSIVAGIPNYLPELLVEKPYKKLAGMTFHNFFYINFSIIFFHEVDQIEVKPKLIWRSYLVPTHFVPTNLV